VERLYEEYKAGGHLKLSHYNDLGRVKGSIEAAVERAFKAADADPNDPERPRCTAGAAAPRAGPLAGRHRSRYWLTSEGSNLSNCSHCRIHSAPIDSSLVLISGFSFKTMFNKELWTSSFPLYSMKPNLRNLFMKKLTRDRVVPIISASIS
jgi:hypothetical protein